MLSSLKKTLLDANSASNRNSLSKSMNEVQRAGQSEGRRRGGEWGEGRTYKLRKDPDGAMGCTQQQWATPGRPASVPVVTLSDRPLGGQGSKHNQCFPVRPVFCYKGAEDTALPWMPTASQGRRDELYLALIQVNTKNRERSWGSCSGGPEKASQKRWHQRWS